MLQTYIFLYVRSRITMDSLIKINLLKKWIKMSQSYSVYRATVRLDRPKTYRAIYTFPLYPIQHIKLIVYRAIDSLVFYRFTIPQEAILYWGGGGLISQGQLLGHNFPLKLYRLDRQFTNYWEGAAPPPTPPPVSTVLRLRQTQLHEKYKQNCDILGKVLCWRRCFVGEGALLAKVLCWQRAFFGEWLLLKTLKFYLSQSAYFVIIAAYTGTCKLFEFSILIKLVAYRAMPKKNSCGSGFIS